MSAAPLKPSRPSTATVQSPPANAVSQGSYEEVFKAFAKFGDRESDGSAITLSNSDKWMKQANIIGPKQPITTTDTGIEFKKIAKTKKAINLKEYDKFLEALGKARKVEPQEIRQKLQGTGQPALTRATSANVNNCVARLTDHTKYTGTHKLRFDDTGKGRGKEGRVDAANKTGYVQGYKDGGTFDVTH